MRNKASTHRLDPEVQAGLNHLSHILHEPKNRLINEAVRQFVGRRRLQLENDLTATLQELRKYREKDPDFARAMDSFVEDEATAAGSDPAEGTLRAAGSPLRAEIQNLLHA